MSSIGVKKFEFSALPSDLKRNVLTFLGPEGDITSVVRQILTLMDKKDREIFDSKIQEYRLYLKYNAYSSHCDRWYQLRDCPSSTLDEPDQEFLQSFRPTRWPQLLDALSTGYQLSFTEPSVQQYTPAVEKDIQNIVQLMPESFDLEWGYLRIRSGIPPLGMACMNPNIPIHMIEWLFQNGADPNTTWTTATVKKKRVRIVVSLTSDPWCSSMGLTTERKNALLALFEKYGAQLPEEKKQTQTTTSSTTTSS